MNIERTSGGKIELWLSDDPKQFRRLAAFVKSKLGGHWAEQVDGLDQSYWDLEVQGKKITVHREHYLGVSVFSDDERSQHLLLEQLMRDFEQSPIDEERA
jgi:hypothetical protein